MSERGRITAFNAGALEDFYERYRRDPNSVDPASRAILEKLFNRPEQEPSSAPVIDIPFQKVVQAARYANALRTFGHLGARLYPLGGTPPGDPALDLQTYQLSEDDLKALPATVVGGPVVEDSADALEAIRALRGIYVGAVGYDFGHVEDPREREWLREAAECGRFRPPSKPIDNLELLDRLTQVEVFEQFFQKFFPGKTRFLIEGVDMLVPALDSILTDALDAGICMLMIGMAHRGRLNVLAHILSKPYGQFLAEFKDPGGSQTLQQELGWTGDVKYHKGASRLFPNEDKVQIVISLPPNPSHLEHIDPVIEGMAHAAQSGVSHPGEPAFFPEAALPVLIHGDASFPGEGVVAETLNLSRLAGYETAGTIHIITNNQIGFTTPPEQERSTLYASDLAKGFKIPVLHVNADDPVACIEAARTAFAYREEFHKDFLIDMIGYRRYGHNEGDEPGFTQPVLYDQIKAHPTVRQLWAGQLVQAEEVSPDIPEQLVERYQNEMQRVQEEQNQDKYIENPLMEEPPDTAESFATGVPLERLRELNRDLLQVPEGFTINPKLRRSMQRRAEALDDQAAATIDWATAEELAFASILADGIAIRLTGQDVERGTFSQRHAAFFDSKTGDRYVPLQHLPGINASFEVRNSPLSENAALGFEYGYNIFDPRRLVLWEAQYGDFINAAQAIVDEFLVSGRAKWGQLPSLGLLLPHGYEGQGPDHSSARIERFLQAARGGNMNVANVTTAAQYFHLIRLHAAQIQKIPRPLILFTPKSLLRNPRVASSPRDLAEGRFTAILDDNTLELPPDQINRLVLCTGKMAINLLDSPIRSDCKETAILRIEQLYPFPGRLLEEILRKYSHVKQLVWAQEEPKNMGAWTFIEPRIGAAASGVEVEYVGRAASSSPAEGSFSWHTANQEALIEQALGRGEIVQGKKGHLGNGNQNRRSEPGRIRH